MAERCVGAEIAGNYSARLDQSSINRFTKKMPAIAFAE